MQSKFQYICFTVKHKDQHNLRQKKV